MEKFIFSGTNGEIGYQIGSKFRSDIQSLVLETLRDPPKFFDRSSVSQYLKISLEATRTELPDIFEEIIAISEAANVSLVDFFTCCCEELWDYEDLPQANERCTDLVCQPPSTSTGLTHLLHTNDVVSSASPKILTIQASGQPKITGITNDCYFLSFAGNSQGLIFSGNALTSNDIKPGVPRLLLFRAGSGKHDAKSAMSIFLNPSRSTSYHNIVLDRLGRTLIFEATADRAIEMEPQSGIHVHTNHYDELRIHELNLDRSSSVYRKEKALGFAFHNYGILNEEALKYVAADHGFTGTDGICRHAPDRATSFAVIATPQTGSLLYCEGSPCTATWRRLKYW